MVILITGASHSGKTALAQKLLYKYGYPYLSIDHLKMGLIRSGQTNLTPLSPDNELTEYLWPIVTEIIKTAIENNQNLIVEGCYIPLDWQKHFNESYLDNIKFYCLILSQKYIKANFDDIKKFANVVESRIYDDLSLNDVLQDNANYLSLCQKYNANYILVDDDYTATIDKNTP